MDERTKKIGTIYILIPSTGLDAFTGLGFG